MYTHIFYSPHISFMRDFFHRFLAIDDLKLVKLQTHWPLNTDIMIISGINIETGFCSLKYAYFSSFFHAYFVEIYI